ncbi:hypothetical protein C5B96_14105 [Subtercola sp. Z020]|uniref:DoxX family protein n=1 Tax=Subtercola sp. Z020 TaxID=2080582 RepID=UPI000CE8396C|nr:hypothetical protein [Subtercola sp. Z020]PPF78793.1 hypothetical protein C5B96_14105 [Subtercola sp. Z020]
MTRSSTLLAGIVLGSGVLHFLRPAAYAGIVPARLPGRGRDWVYASGVAELLVGAGLLNPATRRASALAAAALFVAVFPANVKMFQDARQPAVKRIAAARLPLQVPLVVWALRLARR